MRSIGVTTRQYKPSFNMTLTDGNNRTYSITDNDVQSDSLAIRTGTSNNGELTLGAAIIGSLSVTLLNDGRNNHKYNNVVWRGASIQANFTVHGANVALGKYYVNDHSENGGAIRVTAYDAMQILDSYQIYEHQFTYPLDAVTAVNTIATARGLSVSGLTGVSLSLPDPGTDKMSERAFLSYVAQILCKYVVIKRMNGVDTIYFGWYDTAHPVYDAGTTFSHDLKTSDYTPENFQIKVYDKNYTVTVRGTQGQLINLVTIEGNPFVTSENVGTPEPGGGIAYDMYTKVHALTYRPGTADIVTDIALEAGDVIRVNTGPLGGTYTMIITNLTFGTGLTMSISSDADPADDMIFNPSTYFKKATQQAIAEELGDEDSDLSKAIGGGNSDVEEIILPKTYVICAVDENDEPTFGTYNGITAEFTGYSQAGALWTWRRKGNYAQSMGGIEIMGVMYPPQKIYVPKNVGDYGYVDILVRNIWPPDRSEYEAGGGSSSDYDNHVCHFYPEPDQPARITVRVLRGNNGVSFQGAYDDNTTPTRMRVMVKFSGMTGLELGYTLYPHRIPMCYIPLPGRTLDLSEYASTGNAYWCAANGDRVPSKYIKYNPIIPN